MTPEQIAAEADELARRLRARGYYVNALDSLTDTAGCGAALGISTRQLERWRQEGKGPMCHLTTRWLYPLRGLVAFLDEHDMRRHSA